MNKCTRSVAHEEQRTRIGPRRMAGESEKMEKRDDHAAVLPVMALNCRDKATLFL